MIVHTYELPDQDTFVALVNELPSEWCVWEATFEAPEELYEQGLVAEDTDLNFEGNWLSPTEFKIGKGGRTGSEYIDVLAGEKLFSKITGEMTRHADKFEDCTHIDTFRPLISKYVSLGYNYNVSFSLHVLESVPREDGTCSGIIAQRSARMIMEKDRKVNYGNGMLNQISLLYPISFGREGLALMTEAAHVRAMKGLMDRLGFVPLEPTK